MKHLLIFGIVLNFPSLGFANEICSNINFCQVKKISFGKKGWLTNYTKEVSIKELCYQKNNSTHSLQLEPELGIQLQVFSGKSDSNNPIEKNPWLLVDLYTYKMTFVVASSKSTLDSSSLNFTYRVIPKGNSLIEVTCFKKD